MIGARALVVMLALAFLTVSVTVGSAQSEADDCRTALQRLAARRADLARCIESVVGAHAKNDLTKLAALSGEIAQIVEEIGKLENRAECQQEDRRRDRSLGPVKSDPGMFDLKSCAELQQLHTRSLMTANALKRRARSRFSQLSPSEEDELHRAESDLRSIKQVLEMKCSRDKAPPLRNMLRTPDRSREYLRR